jgi:two-component system chemotaxis response regulator CheB
MLELHRSGFPPLAQDAASCLVDGMPGEAERLGAVSVRLSPEKIAEVLNLMVA